MTSIASETCCSQATFSEIPRRNCARRRHRASIFINHTDQPTMHEVVILRSINNIRYYCVHKDFIIYA